jgi:ADP-heptose:LPS heptosyltransferase
MTLLKCSEDLIGDFLGILPVMITLAKQEELHVSIHPDTEHLFKLVPRKYNIRLQEKDAAMYDRVLELDINSAFTISHQGNYYMSQSHFAYLGLPVPEHPLKAELEFEPADAPRCDYVLAPFSRSLPPEQRWPKERWQQLTTLMADKTFCIIGHDRDERDYVTGPNVVQLYNSPVTTVISLLKKAGKGLISVVSGPSHLAFHLGVKNYLLTNQNMTWGNNPDAVKITDYIPDLKPERVVEILRTADHSA